MKDTNVNKVSLHPSVYLTSIEFPAVPDPDQTRLYAQFVGEVMFVGINTHPAIIQ